MRVLKGRSKCHSKWLGCRRRLGEFCALVFWMWSAEASLGVSAHSQAELCSGRGGLSAALNERRVQLRSAPTCGAAATSTRRSSSTSRNTVPSMYPVPPPLVPRMAVLTALHGAPRTKHAAFQVSCGCQFGELDALLSTRSAESLSRLHDASKAESPSPKTERCRVLRMRGVCSIRRHLQRYHCQVW